MRNTSLTSVPRAAVAWCALAALVLGGWSASARASELRPTQDFADVAAAVNRYADQFGPEHVLLVRPGQEAALMEELRKIGQSPQVIRGGGA